MPPTSGASRPPAPRKVRSQSSSGPTADASHAIVERKKRKASRRRSILLDPAPLEEPTSTDASPEALATLSAESGTLVHASCPRQTLDDLDEDDAPVARKRRRSILLPSIEDLENAEDEKDRAASTAAAVVPGIRIRLVVADRLRGIHVLSLGRRPGPEHLPPLL